MFVKLNLPHPLYNADGLGGGSGYPTPEQVESYTASLGENGQTPEVGQGQAGEPSHSGEGQMTQAELYAIKHGGQEHQLTMDQLIEHAQKGFDYTQKTQKLSAREQEIADFENFLNYVNSNPQLAQEMYELTSRYENPQHQQQFQAQPEGQEPSPQFDIYQHPEFQQMQERLNQMEQFYHQQSVERELNELYAQFPDAKDISRDELFQFADQRGLDLETAYQKMTYGQISQKTQEQMVTQNMRKQIARTQTPSQSVGGNDPMPQPKSYEEIRRLINSGEYNF